MFVFPALKEGARPAPEFDSRGYAPYGEDRAGKGSLPYGDAWGLIWARSIASAGREKGKSGVEKRRPEESAALDMGIAAGSERKRKIPAQRDWTGTCGRNESAALGGGHGS